MSIMKIEQLVFAGEHRNLLWYQKSRYMNAWLSTTHQDELTECPKNSMSFLTMISELNGRSLSHCLMQHAGLQYGQGAVNSHQSPPFAHADLSINNVGNSTSTLRQFRKKEGATEHHKQTSPNSGLSNDVIPVGGAQENIARVPPLNHYPSHRNDYYLYHPHHHQYTDYNGAPQVKYSEIAGETSPHDPTKHPNLKSDLQSSKDYLGAVPSGYSSAPKAYPENLSAASSRQQHGYPGNTGAEHHQQIQLGGGAYKTESQAYHHQLYQKYGMGAGGPQLLRKYAPPPENDFLSKLQRINPTIARSIMSEHHIRESQPPYHHPQEHQRLYHAAPTPQTPHQRYYVQNGGGAYNYAPPPQAYNYPTSCNYKNAAPGNPGAEYLRARPAYGAEMMAGGYGACAQKMSPPSGYHPQQHHYGTAPEYAQHYQHRRSAAQVTPTAPNNTEYYPAQQQNSCRPQYAHQDSGGGDNRGGSGLKHYLENWAEEDTEIYKAASAGEPLIVINSSDIPQGIENVSLLSAENVHYIIKAAALDARFKENTEAEPKSDCMVTETTPTATATPTVVPPETEEKEEIPKVVHDTIEELTAEAPPPVTEEVKAAPEPPEPSESIPDDVPEPENPDSPTKDMPIIEEAQAQTHEDAEGEEPAETPPPVRRTQRLFSVDHIMNSIGPEQPRRSSLQITPTTKTPEPSPKPADEEKPQQEAGDTEEVQYRSAFTVDEDVILDIGGALVQLTINLVNQTKCLSVVSLSEPLVIDVGGQVLETPPSTGEPPADEVIEEVEEQPDEELVEVPDDEICQNEVVIGAEEEEPQEEPPVEVTSSEDFAPEEDTITKKDNQQSDLECLKENPEEETNRPSSTKEIVEEGEETAAAPPTIPEAPPSTKKPSKQDEIHSKSHRKDRKSHRRSDHKKKTSRSMSVAEEPPPKPDAKKKPRRHSVLVVPSEEIAKKRPKSEPPATKAAKKIYAAAPRVAKSVSCKKSRLEEAVTKMKLLKEKQVENEKKKKKEEEPKSAPPTTPIATPTKKVSFNLEVKTVSMESHHSNGKNKLSWEEYSKRKWPTTAEVLVNRHKIMEDTVTSSNDVIDDHVVAKVEMSIENAIIQGSTPEPILKQPKAPPIMDNSWEDDVIDTPTVPVTPLATPEPPPLPTKAIIDVNEFNIEPLDGMSSSAEKSQGAPRFPPPNDDLQQYREVVDSKLNSLQLRFPTKTSSKPTAAPPGGSATNKQAVDLIFEKFLNKSILNDTELEQVRKIIDFKRKIEEEQKQHHVTTGAYEVRNERRDIFKMHLKRVHQPPSGDGLRKRKRFRNLYTDESSGSDSVPDSPRGPPGDYAVFQRSSQGVPKLIFKRKSGLPQPFVKLERSQAVEMMAKKKQIF